MLSTFKTWFSVTVYIQIWENRVKITNIESGKVYDEEPILAIRLDNKGKEIVVAIGESAKSLKKSSDVTVSNPFSHPRVLINEFAKAEKIIQHGMKEIFKGKHLAPSPRAIIHPMEKIEGGLSSVERRAFFELSLSAGAREAFVYVGKELPIYNFNYDQISKNCESHQWN